MNKIVRVIFKCSVYQKKMFSGKEIVPAGTILEVQVPSHQQKVTNIEVSKALVAKYNLSDSLFNNIEINSSMWEEYD